MAFNCDGFILSDNKAVLYNIETKSVQYFNFDAKTKTLSKTDTIQEHREMPVRYKKYSQHPTHT